MADRSSTEQTLHMVYKLTLQQLPDRWVAKSDQFKTFAYGKTQEEAENTFERLLEKAVHTFDDRTALESYLAKTGIEWWVGDQEQDVSPKKREALPERESGPAGLPRASGALEEATPFRDSGNGGVHQFFEELKEAASQKEQEVALVAD